MMKFLLFTLFPFLIFGQTQIGNDIHGKLIGNNSEKIVSLSSDGNVTAIGSPYDSVEGVVRIYEKSTGVWQQIGDDIYGEASGDTFGASVSLNSDGSIVAIGAKYNDGNGASSGHIRIYKNETGIWTQIGDDIDGEASGDQLGYSLSLNSDGSIVAIGAPRNDGNGNRAGHVRIYKNESGLWTQIGDDIDGFADDKSGYSVDISSDGSIVAIGAYRNDGNDHIRIFENAGGVWTQIGADIDGQAGYDRIGKVVSLSSDGSTVAIHSETYTQVRIYKNVAGAWTQFGGSIYFEAASDDFETAISLSYDGNIVAIGVPYNDGNGENAGHVRIFENKGGSWTQIGGDIDGEMIEDKSGTSVSLSSDGSKVAIGAYSNSINSILLGDVRIFENVGGVWTQIGEDISDGNKTGDLTGKEVCLNSDGTILAIGIPNSDGNGTRSGQVRIYENLAGVWTQLGEDINGEALGDSSGYSISLNSAGNIVAIGAIFNKGNGSEGNGYVSGHVRIYENINEVWTQIGGDIDGEDIVNTPGDRTGYSVSLSSDGAIVAIGAPNYDLNGFSTGRVRIYQNELGTWTQVGEDIDGASVENEFGSSVSLSSDGNIVAISAIGNENYTGEVRIYQNVSGTWIQVGEDINGDAEYDTFGKTVSLSSDGTIVVIGAPYNDLNGDSSGQVRVYENIEGVWTQIGGDIYGEVSGDLFGYSLSLSSDGSLMAVGAPFKGQVRIYKNYSGVWTKIGTDINGEAFGDQFGYAVSLNSDGSTLAIGAPSNDGNDIDTGLVRVYDLNNILSTTDNNTKNYFVVYPNPASKTLNISTNNSELIKAIIYNSLGQKMLSTDSTTINVEDLNSGIYVLEILTERGKSAKKIIIN